MIPLLFLQAIVLPCCVLAGNTHVDILKHSLPKTLLCQMFPKKVFISKDLLESSATRKNKHQEHQQSGGSKPKSEAVWLLVIFRLQTPDVHQMGTALHNQRLMR